MSKHFRTSTLLAAGLALFASASVHAAGDADATSGYYTVQPNANVGATGYIITFSWVAPDTDNTGAGTVNYTDTRAGNGVGNGGAKLDDVNNWNGGNYSDGTYQYWYRSAAAGSSGAHTQFEDARENTASDVQWVDPANNTLGAQNPTTATPKFDSIGDWRTGNGGFLAYGSGIQGVTGVFSTNPDGSGAATGSGVGTTTDDDGLTDDFGLILSGFDDLGDPTPTNTFSNTGYVQQYIPYHTDGIGADPFVERFNVGNYTDNAAVEVVVTTDASYVPKIAVSGDFDSDLDVDVSDVIHASGGFTGSGTTGNWYADGDVNADGDVDVADVIAVSGNFTGSSLVLSVGSTVDTAAPDLIYDPSTGNIVLDSDGGADITGFQLENGDSSFVFGNYTSPGGADLEEATADVLSYFVFSGGFANADLGNVLPTGLDLVALEAYLTTADVSQGLGNSGEFDLIVIPEPSSLALLAMGGLLIARRRRK